MKLIIHVGMGKTGTTSIQSFLESNASENISSGVKYLGLMLENSVGNSFDWKKRSYAPFIAKVLKGEKEQLEMLLVLSEMLEAARREDLNLVWSNEGLFDCLPLLFSMLSTLEMKREEIEIICYTRNAEKWLLSAYKQWGIKHKTYEGKICSFNDFFVGKNVGFVNQLTTLLDSGYNVVIRNYDECDDVVEDFCGLIGLDYDSSVKYSAIEKNLTGNNAELLFRAMFNNQRVEQTLPAIFNNHFQYESIDWQFDPVSWFDSLMPGKSDISDILASSKMDLNRVSAMIEAETGEHIDFNKDVELLNKDKVELSNVVGVLIQIVMNQNQKIIQLERKLSVKQ
jgi:hypothetical protein